MSGSGRKIAGTGITLMRQPTAVHGFQGIVPVGWYGVVPVPTIHRYCDPRAAAGSPLQSGTTSSVSVLPETIKS